MSWKQTGILLGTSVALLLFILFYERHTEQGPRTEPPPRVVTAGAAEITNVVLRRTNQLVLRAERVGQKWQLSFPLTYPAQQIAIERLLEGLYRLTTSTYLGPEDLQNRNRTVAEFGLDVPQTSLLLHHGGKRTEVLFGAKTSVGDQVYVQVQNAPGIHVVDSAIVDALPKSANDWRDTSLANITELSPSRIEVRVPGRGFAIEVSPTNNQPYLTRPTPARASIERLQVLFRKIQEAQVRQFVTDDPRAELEPYGLQPPAAELVFGQGTNNILLVQFGKSLPDDPTLVYARRMSQTNIVLVPRGVLDALQTSHSDLRDRHLLVFRPTQVEEIEFRGESPFLIRRQTNGLWMVTEPQVAPADIESIRDWLAHMQLLQGQVEKDVVTDLAAFGLAPPARQYILKASVTNSSGTVTNRLIANLELSGPREGKIYARGVDESIFSITAGDYDRLPWMAWQMRDRRVWTFSTSQVSRISFEQEGQTRQFVRSGAGEWGFAPGSQGVVSTEPLEKIVQQLGELRALAWVAQGDENKGRYGFPATNSPKVTVELRLGDRVRNLALEFGGRSPNQIPYALGNADGQAWIFEFPVPLYYELLRFTTHLFLPPRTAAR